jgi:hypothetical protein
LAGTLSDFGEKAVRVMRDFKGLGVTGGILNAELFAKKGGTILKIGGKTGSSRSQQCPESLGSLFGPECPAKSRTCRL